MAAALDDRLFYESRAHREERLCLAAQRALNVVYALLAERPDVSFSCEEMARFLELQNLIAGYGAGRSAGSAGLRRESSCTE